MLDDGKTQAGAADRLGTALIDPVESFKDPLLVFSGNADAGISDLQEDVLTVIGNGNGNPAVLLVILDGIITEVVDDALQQLPVAVDIRRLSGYLHGYAAGQLPADVIHHLTAELIEIHSFPPDHGGFVIQMRKPDDVLTSSSAGIQ